MRNTWIKMTLLCGALDALYVTILSTLAGRNAGTTWRYVASGPLGEHANEWGVIGVIAGVATHFLIMAVMVGVFLWAVRSTRLNKVNPWVLGSLYGLGLYLVMNAIVIPLRFSTPFPPSSFIEFFLPFLPHIVLVGIPLAFATRRGANDALTL